MGERSILSSFLTEEDAQTAAKKVKALGIEVAKVDPLNQFAGPEPNINSFPITGNISSLASLTLDVSPSSRDAGVLLAAGPSASGMSDGDDPRDDMTGRNYLLTVVCDDRLVDEAVSVIKECNGYT